MRQSTLSQVSTARHPPRLVPLIAGLGGGSAFAVLCPMRDDLKLDAVWVFEEERVVTCRRVLWILSGRGDDKGADSFDSLVKPINLRA